MPKTSILIVEDELIAAESLVFDLQMHNYSITQVVDSGAKAIKSVQKKVPDIILMDIRIKGKLDGIETAKIIKKNYSMPIIYLTAFKDVGTLNRIQEQDSNSIHISKPIHTPILLDAIEKLQNIPANETI